MANPAPLYSIELQGEDDEPVRYAVLCRYQEDMMSDFGVVSAPVCRKIGVFDTLEKARRFIGMEGGG